MFIQLSCLLIWNPFINNARHLWSCNRNVSVILFRFELALRLGLVFAQAVLPLPLSHHNTAASSVRIPSFRLFKYLQVLYSFTLSSSIQQRNWLSHLLMFCRIYFRFITSPIPLPFISLVISYPPFVFSLSLSPFRLSDFCNFDSIHSLHYYKMFVTCASVVGPTPHFSAPSPVCPFRSLHMCNLISHSIICLLPSTLVANRLLFSLLLKIVINYQSSLSNFLERVRKTRIVIYHSSVVYHIFICVLKQLTVKMHNETKLGSNFKNFWESNFFLIQIFSFCSIITMIRLGCEPVLHINANCSDLDSSKLFDSLWVFCQYSTCHISKFLAYRVKIDFFLICKVTLSWEKRSMAAS